MSPASYESTRYLSIHDLTTAPHSTWWFHGYMTPTINTVVPFFYIPTAIPGGAPSWPDGALWLAAGAPRQRLAPPFYFFDGRAGRNRYPYQLLDLPCPSPLPYVQALRPSHSSRVRRSRLRGHAFRSHERTEISIKKRGLQPISLQSLTKPCWIKLSLFVPKTKTGWNIVRCLIIL